MADAKNTESSVLPFNLMIFENGDMEVQGAPRGCLGKQGARLSLQPSCSLGAWCLFFPLAPAFFQHAIRRTSLGLWRGMQLGESGGRGCQSSPPVPEGWNVLHETKLASRPRSILRPLPPAEPFRTSHGAWSPESERVSWLITPPNMVPLRVLPPAVVTHRKPELWRVQESERPVQVCMGSRGRGCHQR